jgi:uncharacterized protein (TIGR02453 family)
MPSFFRQLVKNNDRDWFAANKAKFEQHVRDPMLDLVTRLNDDLRSFAVDHCVDNPSRALYRIYRDTRFSKDKTPYKDHIAATFHRSQLPRNGAAGLYFSANHKSVEIAGGVYLSDPADFAILRAAIAARPKQFLQLIQDKKLTKIMGPILGDQLRHLSKGYEHHAGTPIEPYLRHKQLYWSVQLPASLALTPQLHREILTRFRVMMPALNWMNRALLAARAAAADRDRPVRPEPMF